MRSEIRGRDIQTPVRLSVASEFDVEKDTHAVPHQFPHDRKGEGGSTIASDAKQIIAEAIRLRVVTVSRDQSKYAAEDVLAGLKKAGYELRKK